jgi:DNA-binding HxlR family transcriptional regulator
MRKLVLFLLLAQALVLSNLCDGANEFWPAVRRVLTRLELYNSVAYTRFAAGRRPYWLTIQVGETRENFYAATVNQLFSLLGQERAKEIIEAAQHDRRFDLKLSQSSPILRFIEEQEKAGRFTFQFITELGNSNGLEIGKRTLVGFLVGNLSKSEFSDRALETLVGWINSSNAPDELRRDTVSQLREWYSQKPIASVPVRIPQARTIRRKVSPEPDQALQAFGAEMARQEAKPDFNPLTLPEERIISPREHHLLFILRKGPMTGNALRSALGDMDVSWFSRLVHSLMRVGLVADRKLTDGILPPRGYALTPEGRVLIGMYPNYSEWLEKIPPPSPKVIAARLRELAPLADEREAVSDFDPLAVPLKSRQHEILFVLWTKPMTGEDLRYGLHMSNDGSFRSRITGLLNAGLIIQEKLNERSPMIVGYALTPEGLALIRQYPRFSEFRSRQRERNQTLSPWRMDQSVADLVSYAAQISDTETARAPSHQGFQVLEAISPHTGNRVRDLFGQITYLDGTEMEEPSIRALLNDLVARQLAVQGTVTVGGRKNYFYVRTPAGDRIVQANGNGTASMFCAHELK